MKKYLAIIPVLAFVFALTMATAFASRGRCGGCDGHHHRDRCCPEVNVNNENCADIDNDISANSNTGNNDANRNGRKGMIRTGNADSWATADTTANSNETYVDMWRRGEVNVDNGNNADVDNDVSAYSNTGENDANNNGGRIAVPRKRCGHCGHHGMRTRGVGNIDTGNAVSTAEAFTMVNSNLTDIY